MRPIVADMDTNKEMFLILNKYNFHDWKFELENLCQRKQASTEYAKFAWLVRTLNSADKRLVMKYEKESVQVVNEEKVSIIEGKKQPYGWAVEILRRLMTERNASTPDQLFEQQERAKDRIKEIKIADCSYDINEYFKRFDRAVVAARAIGVDFTERYLIKLFADGCLPHKDLKSRASMVHLEPPAIHNYIDLKIMYEELIPKEQRIRNVQETGRNHFNKKKQFKGKCYNCGDANHSVKNCPRAILKCSKCAYYGHVSENCTKRTGADNGKRHVVFDQDDEM
jgi:ribosomal protein L34E